MPERLKTRAEQIMITDVQTLHPNASVAEAVELFADKQIACAIVVDGERRPKGIVTERDLLGLAEDHGAHVANVLQRMLQEQHHIFDSMRNLRNAAATTVEGVASSPVTCADVGMTVGQLASMMETFDYRQLPVVREGRLVGLVSRQEIIRAIADKS
jgi:CBS domain-containing protein